MNSKNGREILPSSPQYEEMTQLLTIAYQYYDEGLTKLKEGDKEASDLDFDNSNITKAKNLYNEARSLFRSGKLEAANSKISQSLALNPDDTSAQSLSDNINIAIGGTKIPLSTQAQLLYSKSYDNFNQNNYEMAEYYINRIEKLDRRFMNDDDVKRLKEKIDALK